MSRSSAKVRRLQEGINLRNKENDSTLSSTYTECSALTARASAQDIAAADIFQPEDAPSRAETSLPHITSPAHISLLSFHNSWKKHRDFYTLKPNIHINYDLFIFSGTATQRELSLTRSRSFLITYNDVPPSVGLFWTSDQLVIETNK
jgi:hypothetical protein